MPYGTRMKKMVEESGSTLDERIPELMARYDYKTATAVAGDLGVAPNSVKHWLHLNDTFYVPAVGKWVMIPGSTERFKRGEDPIADFTPEVEPA